MRPPRALPLFGSVIALGVAACTGGAGAHGASGGEAGLFHVELTLSSAIPTVGIVDGSIDTPIEHAVIRFGRQAGSWEYEASVQLLGAGRYHALLLGMKPTTSYAVQILARSGAAEYTSAVYTIETGSLPNGLPPVEVFDTDPSALFGGFTTSCTLQAMPRLGQPAGSTPSYAFILDRDGDYVWAYELTGTEVADCSRARMSYDGEVLWIGNFANLTGDGAVARLPMDGLGALESFRFPERHHDFTILPNDHLMIWERQRTESPCTGGACEGQDVLEELDPETGSVTEFYQENRDFAELISAQGAHTNYVAYVPALNALSFSMRYTNTIGLLSYPDAELLGVFGGEDSWFEGMSWTAQHGHQVLADRLVIFNNADGGTSKVLEFEYDLAARTATELPEYQGEYYTVAFGDVQRLSNGNTFVTYSMVGVFEEIDASHRVLRRMETDSVGYAEHRRTLYGPPPPYAD